MGLELTDHNIEKCLVRSLKKSVTSATINVGSLKTMSKQAIKYLGVMTDNN